MSNLEENYTNDKKISITLLYNKDTISFKNYSINSFAIRANIISTSKASSFRTGHKFKMIANNYLKFDKLSTVFKIKHK